MIAKLLFFVLSICAFESAFCQRISELVGHEKAMIIELDNLKEVVELSKKTDFFSSSHWKNVRRLVCHPDHGIIEKEQLGKLESEVTKIFEEVSPTNVLCWIGEDLKSWQVIIRSEGAGFDSDGFQSRLGEICKILLRDESQRENSGFGEKAESVGGIDIFGFGGLFVFEESNLIAFSSDLSDAKSLCRRIKGKQEFRNLEDSRKYQRVRNTLGLAEKPKSSRIDVHFKPEFILQAIDGIGESEIRDWRLNEMRAAGISLNLVPSTIDEERVEILLDGVLVISVPRVGIFEAIQLKGTPDSLPDLPENLSAFWYINLDWLKLRLKREELHDASYGKGSFSAKQKEGSKLRALMSDELRRKNLEVGGFMQGGCFFQSDDSIATLQFREVNDVDGQIEVLETRSKLGQTVYKNYGFFRHEIGGYPAMMAMQTKSSSNGLGIVFKDSWMIASDEKTLESLVQAQHPAEYPEKIEVMIKRLLEHSSIEDDRSILLAIFPEGWELLGNTLIGRSLNSKIYELAKKRFPNNGEAKYLEYRRISENLSDYLSDVEPISQDACRSAILANLVKILKESFGHFVLMGNDTPGGLRVSAMTSPLALPVKSGKQTKD